MQMSRKFKMVIVLVGLLLIPLLGSSVTTATNSRQYRVTFYNLTSKQAFTPPAIAIHRGQINFFAVGLPASEGVKEIAENGNLTPFLDSLANRPRVTNVIVAASNPPPLQGGQSISVEFDAEQGSRYLSFVSMLICTNDGFTGVNSLRLPRWRGDTVRAYTIAYDAGTEINTEDFADLVPPCQIFGGVSSGEPGTGTSNPALAQNDIIRPHRGIIGGSDLLPEVHGWDEPVAKIVIERLY